MKKPLPPRRTAAAAGWRENLHPLFFALFPLLSLYAANTGEVPAAALLRPAALLVAGVAVLGLLFFALSRGRARAAIAASVFLLLFFSYGHLRGLCAALLSDFLVIANPTAGSAVDPNRLLLPLWGVTTGAAVTLVLRSRRSLARTSLFLNRVGTALLVLPLLTIALHRPALLAGPAKAAPGKQQAPSSAPRPAAAKTATTPDIYYIVLDAYGRQDVLQTFYGYNNEPFLRALEKRGFYVARQARANYCQTPLALASSLNLDYVPAVVPRPAQQAQDESALTQRIDASAVAGFLRARGYRYVSISTGTPQTRVQTADVLWGGRPDQDAVRAFNALLLDTTPLGALLPQAGQSDYDQHREQIVSAFDHLSEAPALPGPKFVFAHVLAPHPPFVLGPRGEAITPPSRRPYSLDDASDFLRRDSPATYQREYIGQLAYVNRRVLQAIDAIYARSARRPIIIVQGDHGPRLHLDWQRLDKTDPREAFNILNAYALPDASAPHVFYDKISPVNSFRLLFNHYFGARYARLPDRSYYSPSRRPYDLTDVTDRTTLSGRPQISRSQP